MESPRPEASRSDDEPDSGRGGEESGVMGPEAESWPDEAAEAVFWAEARERGEPRTAPTGGEAKAEEIPAGNLPALDGLVDRLPVELRAALDELFRARFVRVTRLPHSALRGKTRP